MDALMTRLLVLLAASLACILLAAPVAIASSVQEPVSGEGLYGLTNDKVVTNAWFIVILLFPLFVLCMSLLQWQLDKRKERRKAISKRLKADRRWQSGW
jgi:hypothetical protein